MKKTITIISLLLMVHLTYAQKTTNEYEYLTINVIYGLKTSGFVNKLFIDIGKTAGHSLSGQVTNDHDKVLIDSYEFDSVTDLINYLGKKGWRLTFLKEITILSDTYYSYTLEKVN
ncbi:hypothetical protein DNU06_11235 [Putridiphycobacter roseus]|uniref:DUF4177 domain-containing protein n=1 Tax=Putridiphycobacter roseus TaxID=2219161 RepID=A0A2W1NCL9_9FLAO|nr:hypothetical protein [Putridiphycobacter roseus]PZE16823.1 hypothetical protein DNU06_11235 [Putridiphycobacter roseus]